VESIHQIFHPVIY
jgi:hypothetical protein